MLNGYRGECFQRVYKGTVREHLKMFLFVEYTTNSLTGLTCAFSEVFLAKEDLSRNQSFRATLAKYS